MQTKLNIFSFQLPFTHKVVFYLKAFLNGMIVLWFEDWRRRDVKWQKTGGKKREWEDYTELWSQLQIYYDLATDQGLQKADSKTELSMKDAS